MDDSSAIVKLDRIAQPVAAPTLNSNSSSRSSRPTLAGKRLIDVTVAVAAIVFIAPLFVIIAALLLATEGRPIFIRQQRIGRGGKSFACLKLRTMVKNADETLAAHLAANPCARREWDETRKLRDDPRVTALGQVLRKSSFDELPQLFNIVRGEMSLVGPRPIVADEIPRYGAYFLDYAKVRPGLTGLWQVSGRNDVSYNYRVQLDVRYVQQISIANDVVILLKTIPAVVKASGCY